MKKRSAGAGLFLLLFLLSGCGGIGEKTFSLSTVYAVAVLVSLALLVGLFFVLKQERLWFIVLFSSVLVVNSGYFLLSVAPTLTWALNANRLSYFGSVFLPGAMLMIILQVTGMKVFKWFPWALGGLAFGIFLIAASPGYLDIYYREVSLITVSGISALNKVYGPWHCVYLFYLLGYFAVMLAAIFHAASRKQLTSVAHTVVLAAAVFVNIGVWLLEQLVRIDFELLAISYIISELFLIGIHMVLQENERNRQLLLQQAARIRAQSQIQEPVSQEDAEIFLSGRKTLTPTERVIYGLYIDGRSTQEIRQQLNITENTLKYHNKNLYQKLGVSSRKQLVATHRQITPKE